MTIMSLASRSQDMPDIFNASRQGDLETVKVLVEADPSRVNSKDRQGYTPLILAVYNAQYNVVNYLLRQKVNVDAQDNAGNTALMGAIFKGYKDEIALLIEAGADVNVRNYNQATALTFACTFSGPAIVKQLLEAGADKDLQDSRGLTPLDHARMQGNELVIRLLE